MYLSHPVRRMRDDPDAARSARLVVETADDGTAPELATLLPRLDGAVIRAGRFATVVELPERRVADLVAEDGLARVETAATLGVGLGGPDGAGGGEVADGNDEAPADDTANRNDEAPADDAADRNDEAPADDAADRNDEAPADDTANRNDEAPADDTANRNDEAPADDDGPDAGERAGTGSDPS